MIRLLSKFSGAPEDRIRAAWMRCTGELCDLRACLCLSLFAHGLALALLAVFALFSMGR